ncbi:hypothetical protein CVV38_02935 [Candidatus Peregrinibacteria bacterium HGW-Peregrinibacteria-1]|jgi:tetratricopeptide (TPR) repeat protein|nr:MAG: hypothetical protein CVV38_02935 [Candidatus Peregrinibacteria bacterium HGW-Peregrinibacteria-1]
MDKKTYIKEASEQIKVLIANSEFQKANMLAMKTLTYFPDSSKIISLRKRIIKEVKQRNKDLVKFKIIQSKKLSKEENYPEAIKLLKEAQKLDFTNNKIYRLLFKNQEKYKKYLEDYFETHFAQQEQRLAQLAKENPETMIATVKKIELNSPPNKKIQKLVQDYQNQYIDYKIKQNKDLLASTKYTSIETLVKTLKGKTREDNLKIRELESKIKLRQLQDQKHEKYDFIYESKKNLNTLIQLKKYPKALQFIDEILTIAPEDPELLKKKKHIKKKLFSLNRDQIVLQILGEKKSKSK